MNDAIDDFVQYLAGVKNYSPLTAQAYESDVRDFVKFYEKFVGRPPMVRDLDS